MKNRLLLKMLILTSALNIGCIKNFKISTESIKYDSEKHFSSFIDEKENIPMVVQKIIDDKFPHKAEEDIQKFQVAYFLIPDTDLELLYNAKKYSKEFMSEIYFTFSGVRFFKFFIYPGHEDFFATLKNSYRYISQDQSEYFATSLAQNGSMVLWHRNSPQGYPFLIKNLTEIPMVPVGSLPVTAPRYPASQPRSTERSISLTFIKGPLKNKGQEITNLISK